MDSRGLIVFTKNPKLGRVKTRVAESVGDVKALDIYLQLVNYTHDVINTVEANIYIYYSDEIDRDDVWDNGFNKRVQKGNTLGERIRHAFYEVLEENRRVIIIGTDCGVLTADILLQAFRILKRSDVVIGPSEDGGYYLLGLNESHPDIFSGIEWSTDKVFSHTMEKINTLRLSCTTITTLYDVDRIGDWERLNWK